MYRLLPLGNLDPQRRFQNLYFQDADYIRLGEIGVVFDDIL